MTIFITDQILSQLKQEELCQAIKTQNNVFGGSLQFLIYKAGLVQLALLHTLLLHELKIPDTFLNQLHEQTVFLLSIVKNIYGDLNIVKNINRLNVTFSILSSCC